MAGWFYSAHLLYTVIWSFVLDRSDGVFYIISFLHLFFGGLAVRGGVTGRPEFSPPYWYLAFFSDGFNILGKIKKFL